MAQVCWAGIIPEDILFVHLHSGAGFLANAITTIAHEVARARCRAFVSFASAVVEPISVRVTSAFYVYALNFRILGRNGTRRFAYRP